MKAQSFIPTCVRFAFLIMSLQLSVAISGQNVEIASVWFSGDIDADSDGYYRYRRINFDLDVPSGSRTVYGMVSCCKDPILAGPCDYAFSPDIVVTGTGGGGTGYIDIGSPNPELSYGTYQVDLQFYDAVTDEPVTNWYYTGDHVGFEESTDDVAVSETYSFAGAYMDVTFEDQDGDEYNRWRNFCFDANVSSGTHNVYVKLYYYHPSIHIWILYHTTSVFSITGSDMDYRCVTIGTPNEELPHGIYDFKLELMREGHSEVVATLGPADDHDLNDQWFETVAEDQPPSTSYSIAQCYMGNEFEDLDGDEYNRWRNFYFDANISSGTADVYAKLYYKGASMGSFQLYHTTSAFSITGSNEVYETITIGTPNMQLPHDIYDFRLELYESGGSSAVAIKNPADDHDLDDQWFETVAEDSPSSLSSMAEKCFHIYPTPVDETLHIQAIAGENMHAVRVYRPNGELVMHLPGINCNSINLDVSELVAGIYILVLEGDDYLVSYKIVKD